MAGRFGPGQVLINRGDYFQIAIRPAPSSANPGLVAKKSSHEEGWRYLKGYLPGGEVDCHCEPATGDRFGVHRATVRGDHGVHDRKA